MKIIKAIYFKLIILTCILEGVVGQPLLTVYYDKNPDRPSGIILLEKKNKSYTLMCYGGYSQQSAACIIKSEGIIKSSMLDGYLVDVNTTLDSYKIEKDEKFIFKGKLNDSMFTIIKADVFDICGLNANFVGEYYRMVEEKEFQKWINLFIGLLKGQKGNVDLLLLLYNNINAVEAIHQKSLNLYKKGQKTEAAEKVLHFLTQDNDISVEGIITMNHVNQYNDLGFFLEQGEKYKEAVVVLKEVVKVAPERTVAYLNLGDAYWGLNEKDGAKEAYNKYIELMKKNGKEKKIPKQVFERIK